MTTAQDAAARRSRIAELLTAYMLDTPDLDVSLERVGHAVRLADLRQAAEELGYDASPQILGALEAAVRPAPAETQTGDDLAARWSRAVDRTGFGAFFGKRRGVAPPSPAFQSVWIEYFPDVRLCQLCHRDDSDVVLDSLAQALVGIARRLRMAEEAT